LLQITANKIAKNYSFPENRIQIHIGKEAGCKQFIQGLL